MIGGYVFERLFDFISETWELFAPLFIMDEYDAGVVLRWGKFHRYTKTGLNFKWPVVEKLLSETVVPTTMELRAQTLTTKDNKLIVISSIIKYEIIDIKPFMLKIYDSQDVISDTTLGAIKLIVSRTDYANLHIEDRVRRVVKKKVSKYGVDIISIVFADQGCIRTLRLIQDE